MPHPSLRRLEGICADFTASHPIGSRIKVWLGVINAEPPTEVDVRAAAFVLGGHTPVVPVSDGLGCIALTHVLKERAPVRSRTAGTADERTERFAEALTDLCRRHNLMIWTALATSPIIASDVVDGEAFHYEVEETPQGFGSAVIRRVLHETPL